MEKQEGNPDDKDNASDAFWQLLLRSRELKHRYSLSNDEAYWIGVLVFSSRNSGENAGKNILEAIDIELQCDCEENVKAALLSGRQKIANSLENN